jgi:stringent starvation protein B
MMVFAMPVSKKNLCEELLDLGMVMVILDARRDGVRVPEHLSADPKLRLNLSWRFNSYMSLDDQSVHANLSFSGVSFDCHVPWDAIYVMFSHVHGDPYVFPDDVPIEVLKEVADDVPAPAEREERSSRSAFTVVHGESSRRPGGSGDPPSDAKPKRAHLRVIK